MESSLGGYEASSIDQYTIQPADVTLLRLPDSEPEAPQSRFCCWFRRTAAHTELWKLGSGAFGQVYKAQLRGAAARRHADGAAVLDVAVKELKDGMENNSVQFLREVEILRQAGNEYIVKFLGVCRIAPNKLWLVTELLPLGDLCHAIQAARRSNDDHYLWANWGKRVALSIAWGLACLHEKGIIHFDLKSQNVLLVAAPEESLVHAKLADVGVSRHMASLYNGDPNSCAWGGTLPYMAPEVFTSGTGSAMAISPKLDVYSFGVVMWEIGVQEFPRRPLRQLSHGELQLPLPVQELMWQCLETQPEHRPAAGVIVNRLMEMAL